jgi:hypothetical protein
MREEAARDVNANAVVSEEPVRRQRRWYHDLDRLPWRHPVRLRLAVAIPRAQDLESWTHEVPCSAIGLDVEQPAVEVGVHCARRDPEPAFERAYYLQVIYEWRRRVDEHVSARLDRALIVRPETVVWVFNGVERIERIRIR